jgi:undecaprenyl-phosphate 4-deoxy-4-formamido-L-arabinose transferase
MSAPYLSVVVPMYNEAKNVQAFLDRLTHVFRAYPKECEFIFVDDGSSDSTSELLRQLSEKESRLRPVILARNFGQHAAVCAGFEAARGEVMVTLDADLQNPPEEIPKLVQKIEEGFDVVGGIRMGRKDPFLRKIISWTTARMASIVIGKKMIDCGCMLRAYRREVVREMLELNDSTVFIPAMTALLAKRFVEIPVAHDARYEGKSRYNVFRFLLIFFDLITGYSAVPIQLVSLLGFGISGCSFLFGLYLLVRRLMTGPDVSFGVFTLLAILFLFIGLLFLVMGLIGEYISRIYLEVRRRPKYRIKEMYGQKIS